LGQDDRACLESLQEERIMSLTPEQSLLGAILTQTIQQKSFPKKAKFRVEHSTQRDLLNRLSDQGFLNDATHDYIITLKGLRACHNDEARDTTNACNLVIEELRKVYRQDAVSGDPNRKRSVAELASFFSDSYPKEALAIILTLLSLEWSSLSFIAVFEYESMTYNPVSSVCLFEGILDVPLFSAGSEEATSTEANPIHQVRPLTFKVANFRSLKQFRWSPEGVCVLVGPNGSGKTTALQLLECLRQGMEKGFGAGLELFGSGALRNLDAATNELCAIRVEFGELSWHIQPERSYRVYERIRAGSTDLVTRAKNDAEITTINGTKYLANDEMALARASKADAATVRQIEPLVKLVRTSRYYSRYRLDLLRDSGSAQSRDTQLETDGRNLFAVLRNWRDSSEHQHRWSFVTDKAAALFPGWYRKLDFDSLAQRVSGSVLHVKWEGKLPPTDWSDGFFTTLLHLAALASADENGVIAIDEPEISLHPALIQAIIAAMRDWSAQYNVTVLLASHSPVVLDQFREEPDQVFVMELGEKNLPIALDVLKKKEWLAHYSLGDLYSHLEVGAPESSK
jgi:predicted ATPase